MSGFIVEDTMSIGGFSVHNLSVGIANESSDLQYNGVGFVGILGLAPRILTMENNGRQSFFRRKHS